MTKEEYQKRIEEDEIKFKKNITNLNRKIALIEDKMTKLWIMKKDLEKELELTVILAGKVGDY